MKRVLIVLVVSSLCAGIAWVGGYNFDVRNLWVACGAVATTYLCGLAIIIMEDK